MGQQGRVGLRQVGNRAGNFQGAVGAAGRPSQLGGCGLQKLGRCRVQDAPLVDGLTAECLVRVALALDGPFAGLQAALTDGGAAFARRALNQFVGRQRWHFHMQVDAVHQGATELALVAQHLVRRAAAAAGAGAEVATGAGVHGGHQLEAGRKLCPPRSPCDGDGAGLQRLAQSLKGTPAELWKLI